MRTRFDLHIVRSSPDGTAYEDTVDHLSESEREVTGLVFALAGYLVHDVHETVPFILLDSLEAIDSDRIARVVDYFRTHADYLVARCCRRTPTPSRGVRLRREHRLDDRSTVGRGLGPAVDAPFSVSRPSGASEEIVELQQYVCNTISVRKCQNE